MADAAAAGVSEADCKAQSALQTQRMLEKAQEKAATAANAANDRIDGDEAAMCLLEAQSDLPVELVQLVAQYLNSDFEVQPYVSIYKQLQ